MTDVSITPSIGKDVLRLRSATKKSQGNIAEELRAKFNLRIDTNRLSRIENGQETPTEVELDKILRAIGSQQAKDYRQFHESRWTHSAKPPFWHSDRKALAQAEETLKQLTEFDKTLNPGSPLRPQLKL
jgi:transcriptional regulator with XRE-family HTH domain